ncbi:MAG: hypothetical protein ABJK39_08615 [Hyphomicrobiales bacterium]
MTQLRTDLLRRLKTQIADLEGQLAADKTLPDTQLMENSIGRDQFCFGIESIDEAFTHNAMPLFCLNEIRASTREAGAGAGFLCALLAQLSTQRQGPLIWIATHKTLCETGHLYGQGLHALGLDPSRLLIVHTAKEKDALWAAEEALGLGEALSVVLNLQTTAKGLSLPATRRLHLRAEANHTPCFMLLTGSDPPTPSIALTRWQIEAANAGTLNGFEEGIGHPAFTANLTRNRQGQTGKFTVQWNNHHAKFETTDKRTSAAPTHAGPTQESGEAVSGAVVSLSRHRSTGAA